MTYASTRGTVSGVQFSEAVLKGIAPDGGLFVPEEQVRFDSLEIAAMSEMNYKDLAKMIYFLERIWQTQNFLMEIFLQMKNYLLDFYQQQKR